MPGWVRLHRDPRTYTHAPDAMAVSDDAAETDFAQALNHWDEHGFGYWLALDRESGELVGICGATLRGTDGLNLYYRLAFDRQECGLGREMARAATAYAIEFLPLKPIQAHIAPPNVASRAVALASGLGQIDTTGHADGPPGAANSLVYEAPRVEVATAFTEPTRAQILELWDSVNNAGGSVGFTPGAPRSAVAEVLTAHEERMTTGLSQAIQLRSAATDQLLAVAWIEAHESPLLRHTRTVYRVMTDPRHRGRNLGRLLMAAVHRVARADGVEISTLGVRSGSGLSRFYESVGYVETGRVLGAIRIAPGEDRDDITMSRRFDDIELQPDPRG